MLYFNRKRNTNFPFIWYLVGRNNVYCKVRYMTLEWAIYHSVVFLIKILRQFCECNGL